MHSECRVITKKDRALCQLTIAIANYLSPVLHLLEQELVGMVS